MTKYKHAMATGAVAIAMSITPPKTSGNISLVSVRLHLSAVGGAAENFTITINSATAAAYDTIIYSQDMTAVQDLMWTPNHPIPILNGDVLDFAYANSNTRTYGLEAIYETG